MTTPSSGRPLPGSPLPQALWAVPLVGAVLLPGLWWTSADAPFAFRPDLIAIMTMFVALVAFVILALLSRGFRKRIRWALSMTAALIIAAFQWSTFTIGGESVAEASGQSWLTEVFPVVLGGALLWLAVRLAAEPAFVAIVGIGISVAVVVLAVNAVSLVAPGPPATTADSPREDAPSVLFVVLDAYGRADWLEAEYDFDNEPFLGELEARGFVIASEATPNYSYTYASVSTMLNLDYVFPPGAIKDDHRETMRAAATGATGMIPTLKQAGYETAYIENAWGSSQCGSGIDWCIRDGLVRRSLWNLGQMTILAPIFRMVTVDPFNGLSVAHLESLDDWVGEPTENGRPRFTFAHILLPHAPLLLNADCSRSDIGELSYWGPEGGATGEARRAKYTEQISCVNARVIEAVDAFLAMDPDGIVMITGDHGPASNLHVGLPFDELPDFAIQERMKILSAYRVPGCEDEIRADITPVNGTRLVVSCATGASFEPLPDLNFWSDLDARGGVTDITSVVSG